jgi:beta-galactosidase
VLFDGFAPWRDPTITEINRLAMRPALVASDSLNDARARRTSRRTKLDVAHRGLGTASCGPDVLPQYEISAGSFEFSYVVRRI